MFQGNFAVGVGTPGPSGGCKEVWSVAGIGVCALSFGGCDRGLAGGWSSSFGSYFFGAGPFGFADSSEEAEAVAEVFGPLEEFPPGGLVFDFGGLLPDVYPDFLFDGAAEFVSVLVV